MRGEKALGEWRQVQDSLVRKVRSDSNARSMIVESGPNGLFVKDMHVFSFQYPEVNGQLITPREKEIERRKQYWMSSTQNLKQ